MICVSFFVIVIYEIMNNICAFDIKNIKCMFVIAAPEGVKRLHEAHPDVQIYIGQLDRELNDHAYICPGLGDAGDRIFGTK